MAQLKREQFIYDFFKNSKAIVPGCYEYTYINNKAFLNKDALKPNQLNDVIYVSLFPTFLDSKIVNEAQYHSKKIIHHGISGAGILLDESYTIESYLEKHTKRQLRKNLRKSLKQLEASCKVTYEYNCGKISEEKCDFLLKSLHKMIEDRFGVANTNHVFMMEWDSNIKNLHELISQKKTSLFVVYDGEKPISISLNRHINNSILFSETHSYDAEYSKFGLGHIDNYMLLSWCINNHFDFLDLGIGVFDYKKKWCNAFYKIEYHIYYKKNSVKAKAIALFEIYKIHIKNFIKSKNIVGTIKKLKASITKKKN